MASNALVHFKGLPTTAEQELIMQAVANIEDVCDMRSGPEWFGSPWLVVLEEIDDGQQSFIASRIGVPDAMTGETVGELVDEVTDIFTRGGHPVGRTDRPNPHHEMPNPQRISRGLRRAAS